MRERISAGAHATALAACVALLLMAGPLAGQQAQTNPQQIVPAAVLESGVARVDQIFAAEYAKEELASVTVGIVAGPKLVWTKSYGLANVAKKIPATQNTVYRIGSITKQFTAIMLMQLVSEGKLHLSDPVEKYFPQIREIRNPFPWAPPITFLQLATHTSGLAREPGDAQDPTKDFLAGPVADWERILLTALPHTHYAYEPGTRFSYSNFGYAILGAALGKVAGEPYIQYETKHILDPLGMTHSGFEKNPAILRTLAEGYMIRDGIANPKPASADLRNGRGYKVPNGALFTTVGDLARFLSFEMGYGPSSVLKKSVLDEIHSRVYSAEGDLTSGYGIGFMMVRHNGVVAVGHGGDVAGYMADCYYDPHTQIGLIVLRNALGIREARDFGLQVVLKALAAFAPKAIHLPVSVLGRYVGTYQVSPNFFVTITLSGDQLKAQATGQRAFPLFPESRTEFFLKVVDAQVSFVVNPNGRVTGLILHQNGRNVPGKKIK